MNENPAAWDKRNKRQVILSAINSTQTVAKARGTSSYCGTICFAPRDGTRYFRFADLFMGLI